jgi:hypothetical protein
MKNLTVPIVIGMKAVRSDGFNTNDSHSRERPDRAFTNPLYLK